jgi:hypothetical protein
VVSTRIRKIALQQAYSYRQCAGVDGMAVDLVVFSGGTGDVEKYGSESQETLISVHCRTNATMVHAPPSITACL